jgi:hypothetical protein
MIVLTVVRRNHASELGDRKGNISKTMKKKQSGKLKRQPGDFPQTGKSPYSSARSPLQGILPARLRMASISAHLIDSKINKVLENA